MTLNEVRDIKLLIVLDDRFPLQAEWIGLSKSAQFFFVEPYPWSSSGLHKLTYVLICTLSQSLM